MRFCVKNANLSRLLRQFAYRKAASVMAGFASESSLQARSASKPFATSASMSMPATAAGNRPNTERAENRPPTVGSPSNMPPHPSSRACASRADPGSVIATRCLRISFAGITSANSLRTAQNSERISNVPPLFDETMTSVVRGLISAIVLRSRTGESESSTRNFTAESSLLYFVMVMAACVEPPCPMSRTLSMPSSANFAASCFTSFNGHGGLLGKSAQPMNPSALARASGEKSYSDASLACTRLATRSSTSFSMIASCMFSPIPPHNACGKNKPGSWQFEYFFFASAGKGEGPELPTSAFPS